MKKVIVVLFSVALVVSACGKKLVESILPTQGNLTMKVDGVGWTGQQITAPLIDEKQILVVNAVNPTSGENVGIVIEKVTKTGTYKVKGRSGNGFLFSRKAIIYSGSEDGEVIVTAINTTGGKTVPSGTFKATCIATNGAKVVITEGKF